MGVVRGLRYQGALRVCSLILSPGSLFSMVPHVSPRMGQTGGGLWGDARPDPLPWASEQVSVCPRRLGVSSPQAWTVVHLSPLPALATQMKAGTAPMAAAGNDCHSPEKADGRGLAQGQSVSTRSMADRTWDEGGPERGERAQKRR